jgi:REP element-mobilizing transposase RayT
VRPRQQSFEFRPAGTWGGKREGAGRKKTRDSGVCHSRRPALGSRYPVHVTVKLRRELGNLRTKGKVGAVRKALFEAHGPATRTHGFQVVDWSVQGNHIHLIVEAHNAERLSRGMQGLSIRIARKLNRVVGRTGKVFKDRFHARTLTSPRAVRSCRAYVLNNYRRHLAQKGRRVQRRWIDPHSSGAFFDGWKDCSPGLLRSLADRQVEPWRVKPRTWLMEEGWRIHGEIPLAEVPGPR